MKIKATVHFLNGNDSDIQSHYYVKSYRNDVVLQLNSQYYEVHFFTEDVLRYEMTRDGYFSMPGLIILEAIDNTKIFAALSYLIKIGYFDQFVGYSEIPYTKSFLNKWYLNNVGKFDKSTLTSEALDIEN